MSDCEASSEHIPCCDREGVVSVGERHDNCSLTVAAPSTRDTPERVPLAYLITFSCYGAHLHGDPDGSVDRCHNIPGTDFVPRDDRRVAAEADRMRQPPYELDQRRRDLVLAAICEVCEYRGWSLLAAHVRTRHVHIVVQAMAPPERVMNDFKAYSSRKINQAGLDTPERKRWARHGSTLYLWDHIAVEAAIEYAVRDQGLPMAVFEIVERTTRGDAAC